MPQQLQGGPGQQQPGQEGQGTTNPMLAAGPMSPSNAFSVSPEASAARLMSQRGGANNIG
jgi:hypothetical protein